MADTLIEWADTVWNPITGCSHVSSGCSHCYARRMSYRLAGRFGYPSDNPFRPTVHALDFIDEAVEASFSPVERSNSFDSWKASLRILAERAAFATTEYRQILGSLLAATHKRDAADFDANALNVLRDVFLLLRTPHPGPLDAGRAVTFLRSAQLLVPFPVPPSDEHPERLDQAVDELLKPR